MFNSRIIGFVCVSLDDFIAKVHKQFGIDILTKLTITDNHGAEIVDQEYFSETERLD